MLLISMQSAMTYCLRAASKTICYWSKFYENYIKFFNPIFIHKKTDDREGNGLRHIFETNISFLHLFFQSAIFILLADLQRPEDLHLTHLSCDYI